MGKIKALAFAIRSIPTWFHGVFAAGANLRPLLVPQAGAEEASAGLEVAGLGLLRGVEPEQHGACVAALVDRFVQHCHVLDSPRKKARKSV
jgi:hypothetical protein